MKNRSLICTSIMSALLLSACTEPQQPTTPAQSAPAPAGDSTTGADAAFGATAPVELSYDQRRERLLPATDCNLERANGAVFTGEPVQLAAGESLQLSGWVANKAAGNVPAEASLRMVTPEDSRAWSIPINPSLDRSDVQELLGGDPAFTKAGYSVNIDTSSLPAGKYRAYTVYPHDDALMSCDNGRAFVIGQ